MALLLASCDSKPPVSVSARESAVGQGLVITITNSSTEELLKDVIVEIKAPSGEVRKFFAASLNPEGSVNIGWLKLEGWSIPQGSEVKVSCEGYLAAAGPFIVSSPAEPG